MMKIIVGLGNPGEKYKNTRHNAGFMAVDALARRLGLVWQKNKKFNAEIAIQKTPLIAAARAAAKAGQATATAGQAGQAGQAAAKATARAGQAGQVEIGGIVLMKPLTYMNNSGQAVRLILSYYKLLPKKFGLIKKKDGDLSETLIVIHDDIDIELGKYKIAIGSGSAGHNGVRSIIDSLKTKNFQRARIGVKTEMLNKIPTDKFVLQKFTDKELEIVNGVISEIVEKTIK